MSASLELEGLGKRFPGTGTPALVDVTLSVTARSCTAILGPSGSGKSTVLRLIAGLETPDTGTVRIAGSDVANVAAERRGVGMVFQKSLLFPHLSVLDNVGFAARVAGESRESARARAEQYLGMVQLDGFGGRRVGELSGGQEQRVAIARALAAQPAVLLLDEPFSALDPALRADMHDLLDTVRSAASPTVVLVTHDREEASRVADRIAILEHGSLLHESTVADAYRRPRSLRAAQVMGGRNAVPGVVHDGVHRSPLGALRVAAGVPDGVGTLVFRQEDVGIERVDVSETAHEGALAGTIESLRVTGARTDVSVRCAPDLTVHAEVPGSGAHREGDVVRIVIPPDSVHVVAE